MSPRRTQLHAKLVVVALMITISSFFISPTVAQAQFADVIGGPVIVKKFVEEKVSNSIWVVASQAIISSIDLFFRQFAYDAAVGLASGAKGQNPLAFLSEPGTYFNQLAQDSVGELIGTLSQSSWDNLGINLCQPQIPQVAIKIQLGLLQGFGAVDRPKPKCQWQQIANNWDALGSQVWNNPNTLLQNVALQFQPGQSDLGAALALEGAVANKIQATQIAGLTKRLEGNGILPKEGLIAGNIQTPAAVVKEQFNSAIVAAQDKADRTNQTQTVSILNATMGTPVWSAVGRSVLSTFTNTLSQKLLQNVVGGLFQLARGSGSGNQVNLNNFYALNPQGLDGVSAAQQAYSSLLVSQIKIGAGIDIASEFASCPQRREDAGIYNCVIDPQFNAALQEANTGNALTVRAAIAKRYLDGNKPFGFSEPQADKEPDVLEGYAYSNMKKLRLARVIPVGWEFAALKTKETGRKTLNDVITGFSQTGLVPGCGQSQTEDPDESPFCGLVDPDWVLKVPSARCAQSAPGQLVDSNGTRVESCIDLQNCVAEDERGNCKAWGYCTKEKRTWSIGGDSCPAQYATCQTFQNTRTNQQVSYLRNTLDSTVCSSENAGCRWYSTVRDVATADWKPENRIYLNGKAQSCAATAAGCTEFISSTANLIQNPSFESIVSSGATVTGLVGWSDGAIERHSVTGDTAYEGGAAVRADSGFLQTISLEPATQYTLSAYGRGTGGVTLVVSGGIEQVRTTCTIDGAKLKLAFQPSAAGSNTQYARGACSFFTNNTTPATVTIGINGSATTVMVDAVQLVKGAQAMPFRVGYGTAQTTYLKAPPAWLGCTGEEGEPAECRSYARVCRREEAGCEQYTPVTGDGALTGTVSANDQCPAECVGYAAYKQESSAFEGPLYPQYIIPSRAQVCSGEDIGCSAFTNLQSEKVEYYREVRACELPRPNDQSATYSTWEGSENAGYQIKNWLLKQSNISVGENKGECTANSRCSNAPDVACQTREDCVASALGQGQSASTAKPPCTNFVLRDEGNGTLSVECRDTVSNQAICVSGQIGVDPDCRGFYDTAGNIFYRKYSRTVLITNDCSFARIGGTGTQLDEGACLVRGGSWSTTANNGQCTSNNRCSNSEHTVCRTNADCAFTVPHCALNVSNQSLRTKLVDEIACAYGRGTWRSDRQECIYAIYAPESRSCQAASLGCREYTGNAGNNVRTLLTENFDSGIGAWQPGAPNMVQSAEAVNPGGYAARVEASSGSTTRITRPVTLEQSSTYVVEFWAKGSGVVAPQLVLGTTVLPMTSRGGTLTASWQRFSFGPTTIPASISGSTALALDLSGSGARMYIDNVSLKKVAQSLALIQASTKNIPQSCDSTPASLGAVVRAPQYMLGCAEYKDRANTSVYLKSFSRFCRATSVGCAELGNTYNSAEQFGSRWNTTNSGVCRGLPNTDCYYNAATDTYQGTPGAGFVLLCRIGADQTSCTYGQNTASAPNMTIDDVAVSAHARAYLVVDTAGSCKAEEKGCQAMGQKTSSGWNTVYMKNLPDTYADSLCRHEENGCDAWSGSAGAVYFKGSTGTNECVWKDGIQIAGNTYNGWFKQGTIVVPGVTTSEVCVRAKGQWNSATSQCFKGDMPCYGEVIWNGADWAINTDPAKTFLIGGRTFGVWKNIDPFYRGQIASCPAAQTGCTELVDRNDCRDAERKNCTAYYVLDNDNLDKKTCREQNTVSVKEGCVLFDDTSDPDKTHNTALSYQVGKLTEGTSAQTANNANTLLRVRLDRSCAEWLTCQSAASVFDSTQGRFKLVCSTLGRCNEIVSRPEQGEIGQCANWVDQDAGDRSPASIARTQAINERLTTKLYQNRNLTSFTVLDYSGYSLPNFYPLDRLTQVSWTSRDSGARAPEFRLAAIAPCDPRDPNYVNCASPDQNIRPEAWGLLGRCTTGDGALCGQKVGSGAVGRCYASKINPQVKTCIVSPDGSLALPATAIGIACRAYPDRTAPFPSNPTIRSAQAFANANFCDDATGIGCECDYRKASYGGFRDFYYAKDAAPESKVCVGGTANTIPGNSENPGSKTEGQSCFANSECISGDCRALNKVTDYRGVRGYCLEHDESRGIYADENQHPCLTWLPLDTTVGASDVYNQYTTAGFRPNPGNEWYCSGTTAAFNADGTRDISKRLIDIVPIGPNNDLEFSRKFFGPPRILGDGNACTLTQNSCDANCEDALTGAGGWCNWPDATSSKVSTGGSHGPLGLLSVGVYRGAKTNFLGCYEVDAGGTIADHVIENEWIGPGPIYRNMIETIEVTVKSAPGNCSNFEGSTGVPDIMRCNFGAMTTGGLGENKNCKNGDTFTMRYVGGENNEFIVSPVFDESGRLSHFRYQQYDGNREGDGFVERVKILLKPGCQEIQRVSEKGSYTDRLWNKGQSDFVPENAWYRFDDRTTQRDNKFNPEVRYKPWGAVGPNPAQASYIIDAVSDASLQPVIPDYCKSPGSMWCGAAYGSGQLNNLFAKTYAHARWSPIVSTSGLFGVPARECKILNDQENTTFTGDVNLCYVKTVGSASGVYDETGVGGARAPQIRPLGACREDGKCKEGETVGVTIGDKSSSQDVVLGYGGMLQTTMRFYAWANKDHMPLKRIVVDWHGPNDGGMPEYDAGGQNYYRNRRGLDAQNNEQCVSEIEAGKYVNRDKYGFGSIVDRSCDNAYFKFQMTYTCPGKTSPFWEEAAGCPSPEFALRYGGCCVFKPRAKVVDNWDWCSGGGGQVPDPALSGQQNSSRTCTDLRGWVEFAGKVLVAPKYKQN